MRKFLSKYYCSFIYIFFTSFSVVFIENTVKNISPAFMLFISVCLATLYFHLVNLNSISMIYKKITRDTKNFIIVSLISAIIWISTFYSIKMIDAYMYLFVYFVTAAIAGCIVCLFNEEKNSGLKLFSLIALIGILMYAVIYPQSNIPNSKYLYGVLLAMLGGLGGYGYRKFSHILSKNIELTASQSLAIRSYGILFFSYILIPKGSFDLVNIQYIPYALTVTFLSFILPLYFNQRGFLKAGPEMHSIISAACPLVCCILSFFVYHTWSPVLLIESLIVTLLLIIAII